MTTTRPSLFLTLDQAADRLQWSRITVIRALKRHGIGTIGRGRRARLTEADFGKLIDAERQPAPAPERPPEPPIPTSMADDPRYRSWMKRRASQQAYWARKRAAEAKGQ